MVTSFLAGLVVAANGLGLPPALEQLLDGGPWDSTPGGFRVMTLSFLADGCAQRGKADPTLRAEAQRCVARAHTRVLALPAPRPGDGLFLAHHALVLGAADALGPCLDEARHRHVVEQLLALVREDAHAHVSSYEGTRQRWPADHAAALAALVRYDAAHGTTSVVEPMGRWRAELVKRVHGKTALPRSDVATTLNGGALPRGCAQSLLTRYLLEVDPALAHTWWQRYRRQFLLRRGPFVGFREWPPGVERAADVDSGPIVLGIGVAASGLGIAAARGVGEEALAKELEASAALVLDVAPPLKAVAALLVARAIRFQADSQPVVARPAAVAEPRESASGRAAPQPL